MGVEGSYKGLDEGFPLDILVVNEPWNIFLGELMEFMLAESLDTPKNPLISPDETEDGEVGLEAKKRKLDELEARGDVAAEAKKDGTRVGVGNENGKITLPNRRNQDYALERNLPQIEAVAKQLPDNTFIDCEVTGICNPPSCPNRQRCLYPTPGRECRLLSEIRCGTRKRSKIPLLQRRIPVQLEPFDILKLRGKNVEKLPFLERKALLKDLLDELDLPNVKLVWYRTKNFYEFFRAELEGLMLKKTWSIYLHDRCSYWLKCKRTYLKTGRVIGWTEGNGKNANLWGSLVLAKDNQLIGRCGGGFSDQQRRSIKDLLNRAPIKREYHRLYEINKPWTPIDTKLRIQTLYQEESKYGIMYAPRCWRIINPEAKTILA